MRDNLTFYPKPKNRDFMEIYPEFRYDYLFTELSREEIVAKYQLGNKNNFDELGSVIKQELGLPQNINRVDIHHKINNGSLKVEEWL